MWFEHNIKNCITGFNAFFEQIDFDITLKTWKCKYLEMFAESAEWLLIATESYIIESVQH